MEAVEAEGEGGFGAVAVGDEVGEAGALFEAEGVNCVATQGVVPQGGLVGANGSPP